MPTEHLREDGSLAQGYYCLRCGQPTSMYGHIGHINTNCAYNPALVKKLREINEAGSIKQYVFNKLTETNKVGS